MVLEAGEDVDREHGRAMPGDGAWLVGLSLTRRDGDWRGRFPFRNRAVVASAQAQS